MVNIQVDMFEVQLGAALLLQFRLSDGQVVRVLADAGVNKGSGYAPDHVCKKLFDDGGRPTDVWTGFSDAPPRLELIVGTHYDEDHLCGLVPIIEKLDLDIDEIWLPPVQDDASDVSPGSVSGGGTSLVKRLMADDDGKVLADYLRRRLDRIKNVDKVYKAGLSQVGEHAGSGMLARLREMKANLDYGSEERRYEIPENFESTLKFFEYERLAAAKALGQEAEDHVHEHQGDDDQPFIDAVDRLKYAPRRDLSPPFYGLGKTGHDMLAMESLGWYWRNESALMSDHLALETIRKSAANEAINATHLANLVEAIKRRHHQGGSRIRIVSEAIPQGAPRYFRWKGKRFQEAKPGSSDELGFHLMGPSYELIAKLHEKLPIGTYLLAYRAEGLKSGTVTPSNRLSYVMRFHLGEQAILVTGDAGFTDFAPARSKKFYPGLLALLKPLHVLQVAHHGGLNDRFYQALDAGGLPGQTDWSFLLLSHATDDPSRPRAEFSRFVAQFRQDNRNDVSVLFTSRPTPDKVESILDLIHPAVSGAAAPADRGDVRLSFPHEKDAERGGTCWRVRKHGIKV